MKVHHILLILWFLVLFFMMANWFNRPKNKPAQGAARCVFRAAPG